MAGINLLKQLKNRPKDEFVGSEPSVDLGAGDRFQGAELSTSEFQREDFIRLLLICIGVGLIYGGKFLVRDYTGKITQEKQAVVARMDTEIAELNQKLTALKDLQGEQDAFDKRVQELQKKLDLVESVSRNRNLAVRMVDFAVTEMPSPVWLSRIYLDLSNDGRIELSGRSTSMQLVSEYLKRLEGAVFFPAWQLIETQNEAVSADANSTGGVTPRDTKRFGISAKVVKP